MEVVEVERKEEEEEGEEGEVEGIVTACEGKRERKRKGRAFIKVEEVEGKVGEGKEEELLWK